MNKPLRIALVTTASAIVIVGGGVLTARHWTETKNKNNVQRQAVVDKQTQAVVSMKADNKKLVASYNNLHTECEKGKTAYDQLTPVIKAKTPVPECGFVLFE